MSQKTILEEGLLNAMQALDKQILRAVSSRNPTDLELHGVQKWEPIEQRVELVTGFILNELGENSVQLDSVVVLAQAFVKALQLVSEDLGEEGLGELRTAYIRKAFSLIENSSVKGAQFLGDQQMLS